MYSDVTAAGAVPSFNQSSLFQCGPNSTGTRFGGIYFHNANTFTFYSMNFTECCSTRGGSVFQTIEDNENQWNIIFCNVFNCSGRSGLDRAYSATDSTIQSDTQYIGYSNFYRNQINVLVGRRLGMLVFSCVFSDNLQDMTLEGSNIKPFKCILCVFSGAAPSPSFATLIATFGSKGYQTNVVNSRTASFSLPLPEPEPFGVATRPVVVGEPTQGFTTEWRALFGPSVICRIGVFAILVEL
jgi:hypothetical protein